MKRATILAAILAAVLLLSACAAAVTQSTAPADGGSTSAVGETAPTDAAPTSAPEETAEIETEETKEIEMEKLTLKFSSDQVTATGLDSGRKNGTFTSYGCWQSTDYIDVSSYAGLKFELSAHRYLYSLSFYDENKAFVSGLTTDSIIGYTILQGHTAIPEGAKYARFANFTGSGEFPKVPSDIPVYAFAGKEDYELYKKTLAHDGLKIVCLGDSLTEGDIGYQPGVGVKHYLNYPYYLSQIMGCTTVNDGRCGYSVSDYASLYGGGSINVSDADIVLVMLGTNGGITVGGTKKGLADYRKMINRIVSDAPKDCKVILMTPPHATEDPAYCNYGYAPWVENAAKETRALAETLGLPLIDVFADSPIRAGREAEYQPTDGLHLCPDGYKVLAEFIAEKLEIILSEN